MTPIFLPPTSPHTIARPANQLQEKGKRKCRPLTRCGKPPRFVLGVAVTRKQRTLSGSRGQVSSKLFRTHQASVCFCVCFLVRSERLLLCHFLRTSEHRSVLPEHFWAGLLSCRGPSPVSCWLEPCVSWNSKELRRGLGSQGGSESYCDLQSVMTQQ